MNVKEIRESFPILKSKVYNKDLVYLDSAATMQRPKCVIDKWNELSLKKNANIHRSMYYIAEQATIEYELSRDYVKDFMNASCREEIIFTSGATAGLNMLAFSLGEALIKEGDEIIISEAEHHSNIVPWQLMAQRKNAKIIVWHVDDNGELDLEELKTLIGERTKILAFTHVSNVLGILNPCKDIVKIAKSNNLITVVDGSQAVVHEKIDVQDLDCDFYVFSGHKIYGLTGTGVVYGRKELLEIMPPYMGGGEMIENVTMQKTTFTELPLKFEAGTPNFTAISCLKTALEFAESLRTKDLEDYYEKLKEYLYDYFSQDKSVHVLGNIDNLARKFGIFSLSIDGVHHQDLALLLDKMGVAVRSGHLCAQPLLSRFDLTGVTRLSLAMYNTIEELDVFVKAFEKAVKMLRNG